MDDKRTTATVLRDAAGAYGLLAAVAGEQGKRALSKSYANLSRKAEARADYLEGLLAEANAECEGLTVDPRAFDKRIGMHAMNAVPTPASAPAAAGTGEVCKPWCGMNSDAMGVCEPHVDCYGPWPWHWCSPACCQAERPLYPAIGATPTPPPGEPGREP